MEFCGESEYCTKFAFDSANHFCPLLKTSHNTFFYTYAREYVSTAMRRRHFFAG